MKRLIAVAAVLALALAPATSAQLYVKNGGNVGIGDFETTNPLQPLHVKQSGNPVFKFQSTTTGADWNFKINANGDFSISKVGTAAELILFELGSNKVLDINGAIEATSFDIASSREFKTGFVPLDPAATLAKVAELPISRWTYKDDPNSVPHIGPMAEDFQAAFETSTDQSISLTDASGVALAAIQGLHQKVQEKDALIAELLSRVEKLEQSLADR